MLVPSCMAATLLLMLSARSPLRLAHGTLLLARRTLRRRTSRRALAPRSRPVLSWAGSLRTVAPQARQSLAQGGTAIFGTLLVLVSLPVFAKPSPAQEQRQYAANRVQAPEIDGRLDDACWVGGRWESGFTQWEPYEGQAPSERTAFKIGYDDRNLFVAIRAYDSEPARIESRVTRRDDRQGDQVEIYLDSYFDHQTAFVFNVNSAGVRTDFVLSDNGRNQDASWDAIWQADVAVDAEGWTAEIAIPFSQLRFGDTEERVWGLQVRRRLHRKEEISDWQFVPKDGAGLVHRFQADHRAPRGGFPRPLLDLFTGSD